MSKTQINQANIGTVSCGTMVDQDLFDAFISELEYLDPAAHNDFIEEMQDHGDSISDSVERLFDVLDEYAPDGAYFGAHVGDGCDYGFWQND